MRKPTWFCSHRFKTVLNWFLAYVDITALFALELGVTKEGPMLPSKVLMTTKNRQQWRLVTGGVVCWRKAFGSGRGQRLGPKIHGGHKRRVKKC